MGEHSPPGLDSVHRRAIGNLVYHGGGKGNLLSTMLSNVRTRTGPQHWFDLLTGTETCLLLENMLPATIAHQPRVAGSLASVVNSQNSLRRHGANQNSIDRTRRQYYSSILQIKTIPYRDIGTSLLNGSLTITVSSTGNKSDSCSGQYTFYNHRELYSHTFHHREGTRYRTELMALLEAVYILIKVEQEISPCRNTQIVPPHAVTIAVQQK